MKKGLLGSTALIGATALIAGAAGAAEAPTWKLTGNVNFQFYWVDQDAGGITTATWVSQTAPSPNTTWRGVSSLSLFRIGLPDEQDHDWYFGVDEAELQLNVKGTADNGLNYGFKIELNANTTDGSAADEVRLQFSGGWGTIQMGDEDGAEDVMNYGGENLMGATGGFDGDQDDYLYRGGGGITTLGASVGGTNIVGVSSIAGNSFSIHAPSYPTIAGDTSDRTKINYFTPRFSGFQVGASITPTPNNGDNFKADGAWENHIGIGANYDNSFGGVRVRASAIYSANQATGVNTFEDVSAWGVGGILGFGPFSVAANYVDNGDSGQPIVYDWINGVNVTAPIETSFWNIAGSFETGPMYFSVGYFSSVAEVTGFEDSTYEHLALTADYTVAPGLGVYAELNFITDELLGGFGTNSNLNGNIDTLAANGISTTNDTMSLVLGANVKF